MRKLFLLTSFALLLTTSFATTSIEPSPVKLKATEILFPIGKTGQKISLMELSTISREKLESLTGKKMNSFQRMAFKATQKKLRKGIDPDGTIQKKKLQKFFS